MEKRGRLRFAILLAGAASVTVAPFLRDWHWLIDLFTHFQVQAFVLSLALFFFSAWKRKRCFAGLSALLVVGLGGRLFWPVVTGSDDFSGQQELKVTTFNVLSRNESYQAVVAFLKAESADVVVIVEVTSAWQDELTKGLGDDYPYRVARARPGAFGMLLFSRFPLSDQSIEALGSMRLPMISARVETPAGPVRLFGVHPIPPMGAVAAEENRAYLTVVGRKVQAGKEIPSLVLGDLNATPWSAQFSALLEAAELRSALISRPFVTTWNCVPIPMLGLQLDHVLYSPGLRLIEVKVGDFHGSDHRPVTASFSLKTG